MPCFKPLTGWRSKEITKKGKLGITFNPSKGYTDMRVNVPCGQCIGCRLERSRQWAMRCLHEASLHEDNCFITLTYDNQNLPQDKSLHMDDFQRFMKRLRKHFAPKKIRFFHCGEYGSQLGRPHYHACIFGVDFADKIEYNMSDKKLFSSKTLEKLWPYGFNTVGKLTFDSAAYVARYILKKITGEQANKHYETINLETGESTQKQSEYTTMSRRPGIGSNWFKKFQKDVFPSDSVVVNGHEIRPPKFYDKMYEVLDEEAMARIKKIRQSKRTYDDSVARLAVQEKVAEAKINQKQRSFEND